jgi:hypothetical protein
MQGLVRDNGTNGSNAAKLLSRCGHGELSMLADSRANFLSAVGRAELEILRVQWFIRFR